MEIASQNGKKWIKTQSGVKVIDARKSPFELKEPNWVSDKDVERCQDCYMIFNMMNRRHHCRRCGRIFCDRCSSYYYSIPRMGFVDPVRNCRKCAVTARNERDFFQRDIRILRGGAHVNVWQQNRPNTAESRRTPSNPVSAVCYLDDTRWVLMISSGSCDYHFSEIPLSAIKSYWTEGQVREAFTGTSSMTITFDDGNLLETRFSACEPPYKEVALKWLTALQRAMDTLPVRNVESATKLTNCEIPEHFC
ncbi:zinc finger FYVE domain-containing protein 21-like [Artemia franciscana]|uniref:FYVE-type domain-containing protein n=1 Tax=Artemia franciscana TaxID=6661 RepID=A0AA88HKP3_ARTSF|nr:hypothetical protein QYM36_015034 [Artemia franciscana]KAK2707208.1 hypothetical protein QYM36_015034 [Artemia franciscana]